MPRRERFASTGLWLTCGGLIVLAAHQLLTVYEAQLSLDSILLLGGALAGYLVTATGVCLIVGYRPRGRTAPTGVLGETPSASALASEELIASERNDLARQATTSFLAWCEEDHSEASPWNSFDQLVREMLSEQLGAVRVRCYQVLPGTQQLRSLSQMGSLSEAEPAGKCARSGILGHVATTGQEFVAADPTHGELIRQLAEDTDEHWDWVFPVRQGGQTGGLVAVGKLPPTTLLDHPTRQEICALLTTFWGYVVCLEQLRIAEMTDKASGLLTRSDFFEVATRALADSYEENEPVVVVVLALEGLRRLDDAGRWRRRDALVEAIGRLVNRRIRTDDVIGRFSDDRFVMLLRRLDSGLGRLIAAKLQSTAEERVAQLGDVGENLHVRVGLAGSGLQKQPLEALLASAFDAAELARKEDVALRCDLVSAPAAGVSSAPNQEPMS